MRRGVAAALGLLLADPSGAGAAAAPYTFALVPKNTNSPYFDLARDGCKKAEQDSRGGFTCRYVGPDEHGGGEQQVQAVEDLIAAKVDGIAVSPTDPAAMALALVAAKRAGIPVLTWDSDLLPQDRDLRIAYVGTHNYDVGVDLALAVLAIKPQGGTLCIQSGGASAANHNERLQGLRDTLAGAPSASPPGERLTGRHGWTEVDGCPLYTNDDFPVAVQQMEDTLDRYPNLDAFVPTGGFPQFAGPAYAKVAIKYLARIASGSLALVVADTLPIQIDLLKQGLSRGQVGQRPFEMGYLAMMFLKDIKDGKPPPHDPTYTGLDVCTPLNVATCVAR